MKASSKKLSVTLYLHLFLLQLTFAITPWTYKVTWPEGKVTSYTYPRTALGDCLYDQRRDRLICMHNHSYQSVVTTWLYDPELIEYVSVRCLVPHPYPHHHSPLAPTCLCKGKQPTSPASTQIDVTENFYRCQLEDLPFSIFEELDELEVLDLSFNLLRSLSPSIFHSLSALRVLSLESSPLDTLPEGLVCPLAKLEVLNLSDMQLTVFPGHAFRCDGNKSITSSVRWLDLSGNRLNEIGSGSLWYLSHLRFLNLSNNLLNALPPYSLLGALSLTTLELDRNLLKGLPEAFCEGAASIRRLSLRRNMFASLSLRVFETCQNLSYLDLTGNNLSSLVRLPASLPRLRYLGLANNRLTSLSSPLIGENSLLTTLDMSHNMLEQVSSHALRLIMTLQNLYLHNNALSESGIDLNSVFLNMTMLRVLDLSRNQFTSLAEAAFAGLTSLIRLDLSRNRIRNMSFDLDTPLTQMTHLNLSGNLLKTVSESLLLPLKSLLDLDLSDNLLQQVTILLVPPTLRNINLSKNSLQNVPRLHYGDHLQQLILNFNSITEVGKDDLRGLRNLQRLDLRYNLISVIHGNAFTLLHDLKVLKLAYNRLTLTGFSSSQLFTGLPNLKVLDLSHNRLSDIQTLFQEGYLPTLEELDVSYNALDRLPQKLNHWNGTLHLENLRLDECHIREISEEAFSDLVYLRSVSLQGNRLTHFPLFHSHPGVKYNLQGNPITCSCQVSWLKEKVVQVNGQVVVTHDYTVNTCRTLPRGHLRSLQDLHHRDFLCAANSTQCPPRCTCYSHQPAGDAEVVFCAGGLTGIPSKIPPTTRVLSVESGWLGKVSIIFEEGSEPSALEELYLNNSGVTGIAVSAFDNLSNLSRLHLDHNLLQELNPRLFDRLQELVTLTLSGNNLSKIPDKLLSTIPKIQDLDLSYNSLKKLSDQTVQAFESLEWLRRLMLSGNPWQCECSNRKLFYWLKNNESRVSDNDAMYCQGDSPPRFLEADEGLFDCHQDAGLPIEVTASLFVCLPLMFLLVLVSFKFRKVITAVLYSRFGLQCLKQQHNSAILGRLYDVCVLYDHSDRKCHWWVDSVLLPRLMSATWRLRVHVPTASGRTTTTTTPGTGVEESAVYSVRQSAVCVVLVSKFFGAHLHTITCLEQVLQQAQVCPRSLVLLTWGELTKQTLDCGIRPFLGTGQHLPVTAPFFWDRLLYLLPSPDPGDALHRRSVISACRFRSISDVSEAEPEKTEVHGDETIQHV